MTRSFHDGLALQQLHPTVRAEVERPFEEKLKRAKSLIRLYANRGACVSCSFGKDSTVVLWLCLQENPKIPVIWNNTGVEFAETVEFARRLAEEWSLNLVELKPAKSFWQVMDEAIKKGVRIPDGSKTGRRGGSKNVHDACCYYLKEKSFEDYVKGRFSFNFTGLTALESRQRMLRACEKGMEYYHKKHGVWKVHPILYWTPEEVWRFTHEHGIPVNPAYAKYGLKRIGCVPCTSHRGWRSQLAKVNPAIYRLVMERYFGQKIL